MDHRPASAFVVMLAAAMFVFMLAPILIVVPISFSADSYMSFPPSGWSTRWYAAVFQNGKMLNAFWISLSLGLLATGLSIAIGLPAAYALVRLRPRGADAITGVLTAPLLLPSIVLGLALLVVFATFGLLGTFKGFLAAHLVITLPYAVRVLSTSLETMPIPIEEAAASLGASPLRVFYGITLPMMRSGLAATAALAFLISFDEVVLSLFMSGPRASTLPVEMYHHVENEADPLVAAISVLLIGLTFVVVLVVDRTVGLTKTFVK